LKQFLNTDDAEVRNRLKNIVQYITDHGPQGVETLMARITDPKTDRAMRTVALDELCMLAGKGNGDALTAMTRIAANSTLGLAGQEGSIIRSEIMTGIQRGLLKMGQLAITDKQVEETLLAAFREPLLRSSTTRALGEAAAGGNAAALDALVKPEAYGLTLSSTINALRPAVLSGDAATRKALAEMVEDATESVLFQIALTIQSGGTAAGKNYLPVVKRVLEQSTNGSAAQRALTVLQNVVAMDKSNGEAAAMLEEWTPKVQALLGPQGGAGASTTIRIQRQVVPPPKLQGNQ
jgi:hypothetical protein